MSVVVIFSSIAVFRYELAVVLPETHEKAANVLAVCLLVAVFLACFALILPFLGHWLLGKSFHEELKIWLWAIPPFILFAGIYQAGLFWCTRTQEFGWYSLLQVVLPLLTVLSQITAALLGWKTAGGLIIGTIIGQFASAVLVGYLIYRKYGVLIAGSVRGPEVKEAFIRYKNYPLYMTPYTLVGTIRDRLVYFLLANFGGKAILGFYSLSARLVNLPNSLVSSAIRPVFFQKAASTDFRTLEAPINSILHFLAIAIVPFWVLFLFHSTTLFAFIFGPAWQDAGLYAAILSVPAIPLLLGNWLDRTFDALGRQRLAFTMELCFSIATVIVLTLGMVIFKNVLLAVILQAVVLTIYYSFWLYALFRVAGFNSLGLGKLLGTVFLTAFLSAAVAWIFIITLSSLYAIVVNAIFAFLAVGAYCLRQRKNLHFIGMAL